MTYKGFYIAVFIILCWNIRGWAQEKDTLVSGDFRHLSFAEFVQKVEASTPYHVYYDPGEADSISVDLSVSNEPLAEVLDRVLTPYGLYFAIDRHLVFVTKNYAIRPGLPAGFFEHGADTSIRISGGEEPVRPVVGEEPAEVKERQGKTIAVENKLFSIGLPGRENQPGDATISGYVYDGETGEVVPGVVIRTADPEVVAVTDQYGYYSLLLPRGRHTLLLRAISMFDARRLVMLYSSGRLDINLEQRVIPLKVVEVNAEKSRNVKSSQMGMDKIGIRSIKQIPAVFGEVDILRAVLALPGVLNTGEASTGFNVRGGATDQNLVLLDGNTIYNPSHFFGFFSAFDADVVKEVELYKANIPAQYGGRLSSVLNVTAKEGNKKEWKGSAGIGPLTGKVYLEGPLVKNKTSVIAGFRTTYSDWLVHALPKQYRQAGASFYDATLALSHKIDNKNNLYLTGYMSRDHFNLEEDTLYGYQNRNINLRWQHLFGDRMYGVFSAGYDHYQYQLSGKENPVNAYELGFGIDQYHINADFTAVANNNHTLKFGLGSILYKLHPGSYLPAGKQSLVIPDRLPEEQAAESAFYIEDHFTLSDKLALDYGIRYSLYSYLGPQTVFTYPSGGPREVSTISDTLFYGRNKVIKTYQGPDFRVSLRYLLPGNASLKTSFNSPHQFIHRLSNTAIVSPTDTWKLSDYNIKPQEGYQLSLGFYKNFKGDAIETSVEAYYKEMRHYSDYKSGAVLTMNHHIETDLVNTRGRDYGVELLVRKVYGKLNGWISYTYSRALLKIDDPREPEQVNEGEYYPASFDKPNSFNLIGNYRLSHRFSVSLSTIYATGRPVTYPIAIYDYGNSQRVLYSKRNQYRIPDYFRTDVSMNIEGNAKIHQKTHNSWTMGVYNVLGRKNPYSIYFVSEGGKINGYKLSIFGSAIPYLTFNIRF